MAKEKITLTRSQSVALAVVILLLCVVGLVFNFKKIKNQGLKLQEMTVVQTDGSAEASEAQNEEMEE